MAAAALRTLLISLAACAFAAAAPPRALDQARIHASYHDGDFDKVIRELETFQKSGRACTRADSVFTEKHLAVVYAANPGTRELGRYHMFRLLDLAPGSDLLDMFVGEEVSGVFEKVGKEYALRNAAKAPAPVPATPAPHSALRPALKLVNAVRPAAKPVAAASARTPVSAGASVPAGTGVPDASHAADEEISAGPAWKEPGLWIGGGAALAVVAFTLFYAGSSEAPQGRTYVVPSTASR